MQTAPVTLIASYRVKPGADELLTNLSTEYAAAVEAGEPRTNGLGLYLNRASQTFTHVQMAAEPEAFDAHLRRIQDFLGRASELLESLTIEVYGIPGLVLSEALRRNAEAGAQVTVHEHAVAGFGRTAA